MTARWFFRLTLALPILIPLPCVWIANTTEKGVLPQVLDDMVRLFAASLLFGGIPYCFFAIHCLLKLNRKEPTVVMRRMFRLPLQFCGWFLVYVFVCAILAGLRDWSFSAASGPLVIGLFACPFTLLLGAFYASLVYFGYRVLHRCGIIMPSSAVA